MSDIVERLYARDWIPVGESEHATALEPVCDAAANEIERLRYMETCWKAEIERLRAERDELQSAVSVREDENDGLRGQINELRAELAAAKAVLLEIKDQCRMADMMQWPNKLYSRLCAELGYKK